MANKLYQPDDKVDVWIGKNPSGSKRIVVATVLRHWTHPSIQNVTVAHVRFADGVERKIAGDRIVKIHGEKAEQAGGGEA